MRGLMMMALAAAAVAVPMAVLADPPAVTAPMMPAVFNGAPRNDSGSGQFTVNFDDQGRYLGTGSAPEHLAGFDSAPTLGIRQASVVTRPSAARESAVNAIFVSFQHSLRELALPLSSAPDTTR